ncbi:MAG: hypothetical protein OXL97_04560 [Chloroflexota bacterium]|nr:hypothetical protein [Chloroflexota bacterium]MDE2885658.1 hypothetical protein [Chloroflexota bacterium]
MNDRRTPAAAQEAGANSVAGLVERAFHYRGDVTVHTDDGRSVTGYLFNRDARAGEPFAQLFETATGREVSLPYHRIAEVLFTGRDAAAAADRRFEALQDRREGQARMGAERDGD